MSDILNNKIVGSESESPVDPDAAASVTVVASALDRLAAAERASAPSGFEQRLARATFPSSPVLRIGDKVLSPAVANRPWHPLRLAAAIGLIAAIGAAYFAVRSSLIDSNANGSGTRFSKATTSDTSIDLLVLAAVFEDSPILPELESIRSEAASLEEAMQSEDGFSYGGAM